jgi:hypothetical protein
MAGIFQEFGGYIRKDDDLALSLSFSVQAVVIVPQ